MADPAEGPGRPLILDQSEARRAEKTFFLRPPPPYLTVWMTGLPPYLMVWIRHWFNIYWFTEYSRRGFFPFFNQSDDYTYIFTKVKNLVKR